MTDETTNETTEQKKDHEPPKGAETSASWGRGRKAIAYTATGKWTVLRKKEKPAAEIFSASYVSAGAKYSIWHTTSSRTFNRTGIKSSGLERAAR